MSKPASVARRFICPIHGPDVSGTACRQIWPVSTRVLRPAYTVEVRFDEHGNRLGYRIVAATVNVQKRLSYDEADRALESGDEHSRSCIAWPNSFTMRGPHKGAITFRRPELKIRVNGR